LANRLPADHIEMAGIEEARITAASEIDTVQVKLFDEIADAVHRRIPRAAGIANMAVWGDLDHVKVDIHARRPGLAHGHGHAEADRLRAELEELVGKPVQLNILEARPEKGR
jgi:ribosomal protein S3